MLTFKEIVDAIASNESYRLLLADAVHGIEGEFEQDNYALTIDEDPTLDDATLDEIWTYPAYQKDHIEDTADW